MSSRANRAEDVKRIVGAILSDIDDYAQYQALYSIFLDEYVTSINWDKATSILYEYVPDMFGTGFQGTITYKQLADEFDDYDGESDRVLDYATRWYNASPDDTIDFGSAVDFAYEFCRDNYTDEDDGSNYAYAKRTARRAFKTNTFF